MKQPLEPVGVHKRYIGTNGIRLHVAEMGAADAPPIFLLHGFPEFWLTWRHLMPVLADAGYKVIAPDLRGYNFSDKPLGIRAYHLDTLVDDLCGLLDAYAAEEAPLIAHDWGGGIAWRAVLQYPERFSRYIAINTPHPLVFQRAIRKNREQRRKSRYMFCFQLTGLAEWWLRRKNYRWLRQKLIHASEPRTFSDAHLEAYVDAWSQPGALTAMLNWYRALFRCKPKPVRDPHVQVPTLLIWGLKDIALDAVMARPSIDFCKDGQLITLRQGGHFIHEEEPATVNQHILKYLGAVPSSNQPPNH